MQTITVRLTAKVFTRFALFDTLLHKKRWRPPALFAAIMLLSSFLCFLRVGEAEGAELLAGVLLLVGLVLPFCYFLRFYLSVREEVKRLGLSAPREVYTLTLTEGNIHVKTARGEEADYPRKGIHAVYRRKGCVYLYVSPSRAFLLPDEDLGGGREELLRGIEKRR